MSKYITGIFVLVLLLAACGTPAPGGPSELLQVERTQPPADDCRTLHTFDDGSYLLLCAAATPIPGTETMVPLTLAPSNTPGGATATRTPRASVTPGPTSTGPATSTPVVPSSTPDLPTLTPTTVVAIAPYPSAPLCVDHGELHDHSEYHGLWDSARGCHYDHEHGQNPFTDEVAAAFPGFDLKALLGGVEIGHTNPSSPIENVAKHGGFKWDVTLEHSNGECKGREGVPNCVRAFVDQYHAFGNYAIEMEARVHSNVFLGQICPVNDANNCGTAYITSFQDFGQRVSPYQAGSPGTNCILDYPDSPQPAYDSGREPYFSIDPIAGPAACQADRYPSWQFVVDRRVDSNSTWIAEAVNIVAQKVNFILFRLRDAYRMLLWDDGHYPFTFLWLCSSDQGVTYNASVGCRYNNTTTRIHEVGGEFPKAWDNLQGWDTNPEVGRLTLEGFLNQMGQPVAAGMCVAPGVQCFPIKLLNVPTGKYGSGISFSPERVGVFDPLNLPERDIYFCGSVQCGEFDPGSRPSGWIGTEN